MKKIILSMLLLVVAGTASAQWHHNHHRGPQVVYRDSNWIAPLIIGGIVGSVIANNNQQPVIVQQQPIYVQPQSVIVQRQTVCTEWKEIQQPDGQVYRERTCTQ
jgi:hypothetical protein